MSCNMNNLIGWTGAHISYFKVRDDTHMTSMKIAQFLRPLTPPLLPIYVQNSKRKLKENLI